MLIKSLVNGAALLEPTSILAARAKGPRYTVREPCSTTVENHEHLGAVVNMSVAGAAVYLDVELEAEPETGTTIELEIQRIGTIRTRVVRPLIGGIAVEFIFDKDKDRRPIVSLWNVLNDYSPTSNRP